MKNAVVVETGGFEMQGENHQGNVVSIFGKKEKVMKSDENELELNDEEFDSIIEKNRKNKERERRERLNANKSVLRSYRIKH